MFLVKFLFTCLLLHRYSLQITIVFKIQTLQLLVLALFIWPPALPKGPMKLVLLFCLSTCPSVTHFYEELLSLFSWCFCMKVQGYNWKKMTKPDIWIFFRCPGIWVNEANLDQKWLFWHIYQEIIKFKDYFV